MDEARDVCWEGPREPVLPGEYTFERDAGSIQGGATVYLGTGEERDIIFYFESGWTAERVEEAVFAYDHDLIDFAEGFFALCHRLGVELGTA